MNRCLAMTDAGGIRLFVLPDGGDIEALVELATEELGWPDDWAEWGFTRALLSTPLHPDLLAEAVDIRWQT